MEGVNSTMIYCKNFCKCHQYNNNMTIKRGRRKLWGVMNVFMALIMNVSQVYIYLQTQQDVYIKYGHLLIWQPYFNKMVFFLMPPNKILTVVVRYS
jgi:hypothetical protein